MATLSSMCSVNVDLPPSCIAFCPSRPHLFVVGTYFLHPKERKEDVPTGINNAATQSEESEEDDASMETVPTSQGPQKRTGSLILYHLDKDAITQVSTSATDFAVLDIQWTRHPEKLGDLLAVATSTGLLAFYRLHADGDREHLVLSCVKQITDSSTLVLSLTWHPFRPHVLGLTLSNGSVCLCESTEGELWSQDAVICMSDIHKHELEAWIMNFTPESTDVLSGGDDMVLQCSHINELQDRARLWQDRKLHDAGVTAILPLSDTLVVTGSYDDHIRLLSLPRMGRRQTLASLNLDGGVWRLKLLISAAAKIAAAAGGNTPSSDSNSNNSAEDSALQGIATSLVLLASCMHAGTRVVRLARDRNEVWSFAVLARFEEHKSMNYGSDVQPAQEQQHQRHVEDPKKTIVSTSFYDKLMCLWRIDLNDLIVPSD